MKIISALLGLLSILLSSSVLAKDYYVCDTGGDDKNSGTLIDKPFLSYTKAFDVISKMDGGDSVSFCRGGSFELEKYSAWNLYKVSPEKPGVIKDYFAPNSTGEEPLPKLINPNGGVFYIGNRNHENPNGGLIIQNLHLVGAGKGAGVMLFNGFTDVTIDNVIINGFGVGIQLGNKESIGKNFTIKNSQISNNLQQGLLGAVNDLTIDNNKFVNNGFGGAKQAYFYHNIYISGAQGATHRQVENIVISRNYLYQSAMVNGKCGGASLAVHGRVHNIKIVDNTVEEDAGKANGHCYGIGLGTGYNVEEFFDTVEVSGNIVKNVGNIAIAGGSITNARIYRNHIIDEAGMTHIAIAVPDKPDVAPNAISKNVTIMANQITMKYPQSTGIRLRGENPITVNTNEIRVPSNSKAKCFVRADGNSETDITKNKCSLYDELSFIDLTDDSGPPLDTEAQTPEQSQQDSANQENIEVVIDKPELVDNINPLSPRRQTRNTANEQKYTEANTPELANTPRGSASSSGSSSSSSSSSSNDSNSEQNTSEASELMAATAYLPGQSNQTPPDTNTILEVETDLQQMNITSSSTRSSLNSITVKDVISASQLEQTVQDVTQCRAYSGNRCLLK